MLVAPRYAKRLNPRFVESFSDVAVPWGSIGYVIYKRTYARLMDSGITEEWYQTCARCVNGLIEIGAIYTHEEAQQLFWYMFSLKGTPAGRPIWQLGTSNVRRLGGDSLQNCWLVACNEYSEPFTFCMNELMLGGGVGFNITPELVYEIPIVKYNVKIERVDDYDCDYIVADNREAWVELLERILNCFFKTGKNLRYDTRCIRAKGRRINGFGGVASGPEELVKGLTQICSILSSRHGRKLTPTNCLDIFNIIAQVIIAGNTRRSAEIGIGSADDPEFLGAKDWSRRPIPAYRQLANLTIATPDVSLLPEDYWRGYEGNGEAYGLYNQELCRHYGRLIDGYDYRPDPYVIGTNPCIVGETWIQTSEGPRQAIDLIGKKFVAVNDGEHYYSTDEGFFSSGIKEVVQLTTERGYSIILTKNHELEDANEGWKAVSELKEGDTLVLQKHHNIEWRGTGGYDFGYQEGTKAIQVIPRDIETYSSSYYIGFLIALVEKYGLFTKGNIEITCYNEVAIQRMFMRLGVLSTLTGDGLYVNSDEYTCKIAHKSYENTERKYTDRIVGIKLIGNRLVYDCQIPGANRFDANGFSCANCGEIPLESYESCNLSELFLPNITSINEFAHVAELIFRGNKAISCLPTLSPRTQEVVSRNHRIGVGVTGVLQSPHLNSAETLDAIYTHLEEVDCKISKEMSVGKSIKISTVKPSGSMSLLAGVSPGGHAEYSPYYIRRVMFANDDPIVKIARDSGYNMEPKLNIDGSRDHNTIVIEFPVKARPGTVASSYSAAQQLADHEHLQTYWADNAVSKTIYMQPDEVPYVREWLRENYHDTVKTISVSLHKEHGFKQAPYEEITEAQYNELASKTTPIDYIIDTKVLELIENQECSGASCPIK